MDGITHISETFAAVRRQSRAALMPYFTLGYPDPQVSFEIVQAIAASGADLIELGLPFSDPLADGPTIQHSTQLALEHGMTISRCLELAADLRHAGVSQPLLLMGYYNPLLAFGIGRFAAAAAAAGVDGLIVPDLPVEEAAELETACREQGLALVYLLAPTSAPERARLLGQHSSGFLYLVSLTGVTGAREALGADLGAFIERVRAETNLPLAVGFGISTPEQAAVVGGQAEGVIVGSALISAVRRAIEAGQDPRRAAGEFVGALRAALETEREAAAPVRHTPP